MLSPPGNPEIFLDGRVTQYCGDVRAVLARLPDDHFDCVVTSPPYWGLRNYGTGRWVGGEVGCAHEGADRWYTEKSAAVGNGSAEAFSKPGPDNAARLKAARWREAGRCINCGAEWIDNQLGLERTLGEHLAVMVEVFREVRRVLKPTGTCWINYGDCYATATNGRSAADTKAAGNDDRTFRDKPFSTCGAIYDPDGGAKGGGFRGKNAGRDETDADMVPRGRVVAGGYLKPKDLCMVPNRLAIALQDDGWWVRSEIIWHKPNPMPESTRDRPTSSHEKIWLLTKRERYFYDADAIKEPMSDVSFKRLTQPNVLNQPGGPKDSKTGNRSHKKAVNNQAEKLIKHGKWKSRYDGWENYDKSLGANARNVWSIGTSPFPEAHFATFPPDLAERCIKAGCPEGGTVLDPFGGAGTTALVAVSLGRTAQLIELNPDYCRLARARIESAFMGKEEGARHMAKQLGKVEAPGPLFDQVGQP